MNKLTEIRKALELVTPGPWNQEGMEIWRRRENYGENGHVFVGDVPNPNNANLIAHAPEYITYLISLLEEKDKALKESNEALEFYADTETWDMKHVRGNFYQALAHEDNGNIARKALNTSSNNEGEI